MNSNRAPRNRAIFPLALIVGFATGYLAFVRPPSSQPGQDHARSGNLTPVAIASPSASTDEKAQRLFAAALRPGNAFDRYADIHAALDGLSAEDFRAMALDLGAIRAMAEKLRSLDEQTARLLASGLVGRWLAVDPDFATDWIPRVYTLIPKGEREFLVEALAEKRPEQMLAIAATRKDPAERAEVIRRALRVLAEQDVAKAQAWLNTCTDPADRPIAEKAFRLGVVKADPSRAIELAKAIGDPTERFELMSLATDHAARMGASELRRLATTPMDGSLLSGVLQRVGERDPELGVALAIQSGADGGSAYSDYMLRDAFGYLAGASTEQAIARLKDLEGNQRALAARAIGEVWLTTDPERALGWLAKMPVAERSDPYSSSFGSSDSLLMGFGHWANANPAAAKGWAAALAPGETREKVYAHLARVLMYRRQESEALQALAQAGAAADPKLFADIASSWTRKDPSAAAEWATAQPAGPAQTRALASVVGTWSNENPAAVEHWLGQFPSGAARDASTVAFLQRDNARLTSPALRQAEFDHWFPQIEDPWMRSRAALHHFWEWREQDPAGARKWIDAVENVDSTAIQVGLRNVVENPGR